MIAGHIGSFRNQWKTSLMKICRTCGQLLMCLGGKIYQLWVGNTPVLQFNNFEHKHSGAYSSNDMEYACKAHVTNLPLSPTGPLRSIVYFTQSVCSAFGQWPKVKKIWTPSPSDCDHNCNTTDILIVFVEKATVIVQIIPQIAKKICAFT